MQYRIWCQNNGDYKTLDGKRTNWNGELVWKMRTELDMQWDLLEEDIPVMFGKLQTSSSELFQHLKAHLESKYV